MDGEQHRGPTPKHKRKRKKAKGGKGGSSGDRAGGDGQGTSGGVAGLADSAPSASEREEQRSSNINTAPSQPQQHHRQKTVEATDGNSKAAGNSGGGGGGDGGNVGKKSKKRRRKEAAAAQAAAAQAAAAQAAAAQAAQHQTPPSPPGVAVASPHGGGTKKAKKAKSKSANSTTTNDKKPVGIAQRGGSQSASPPPGFLARGSGSGGGRSGGSKVAAAAGGSGAPRLSELQQRMRQKLEGAQFRMINETLYTSESKASLAKFKREPELFDVYHRGFREQVEKWPVHPLDIIIGWLGKYPKARVADFGCGEARLAATVPNKVHSFDLVSPNPLVTACDMANVPIKDASVHVAVFCLSLMGTNLADFLREAHRVLVPGGLVKVAEVRSRFEGEEGGVERFLEVTKRLGFDTRQMDRSNKMFLMAEFKKSNRKPEKGVDFEAKACIYKRR